VRLASGQRSWGGERRHPQQSLSVHRRGVIPALGEICECLFGVAATEGCAGGPWVPEISLTRNSGMTSVLEVRAELGGGFYGAIPNRAGVGLESRATELIVDDLDDDVVGIVVMAAK
jgi:hypothetical protein